MQPPRNYYAILGISRDATHDEIKKAFRKLARQYHPDVNSNDTQAEDKFKDINEAYDVLSDETKRADYDLQFLGKNKRRMPYIPKDRIPRSESGRSESSRNESGNGSNGRYRSNDDFRSINDFSPGTTKRAKVVTPTRPRRRDVEAQLSLPLEKAYRGGRERIRLQDGRSLEVEMPPGMTNGQKIRLKGQGMEGGDLYLKITILTHECFQLQGMDLFCRLPVTPTEAILGGAIEVPTIDGLVKMTLPKGVKAGQRLRLSQKGYPRPQGDRGDQLVEIQIVMPPEPSPEELELYSKIRALETFNPRLTSHPS